MATKLKGVVRAVGAAQASQGTQDNSVAGLVESIRKHKKIQTISFLFYPMFRKSSSSPSYRLGNMCQTSL